MSKVIKRILLSLLCCGLLACSHADLGLEVDKKFEVSALKQRSFDAVQPTLIAALKVAMEEQDMVIEYHSYLPLFRADLDGEDMAIFKRMQAGACDSGLRIIAQSTNTMLTYGERYYICVVGKSVESRSNLYALAKYSKYNSGKRVDKIFNKLGNHIQSQLDAIKSL
jgi:hypothetical protein